MNATKETILKNAYRLFCEMNYEKVTVPELERATGISRGGIFHYTGNKQKLFIEVVDKYILSANDPDTLFTFSPESSLLIFIHQYISSLKKITDYLLEETCINGNPISKYYHLILQANKYYPGFNKKWQESSDREYEMWLRIIENSKKSGEIKETLNSYQLAKLFRWDYLGMAYETSYSGTFDIRDLQESFLFIYDTIKKG